MNRLTRILPIVLALIGGSFLFGCGDDPMAPPEPSFAVQPPERPSVLTPCKPQPDAMAVGLIGPKGGTLRAGKHVLTVPPGALSTPVWIRMEAPWSMINQVTFSPSGLVFNSSYPALLTISYANCAVLPGTNQWIVQINDQLQVIETTASETNFANQTVTGKLLHFSDYALSTYAVVY